MGNAGIARELLRYVRVSRAGDPRCAFARPDQPGVRETAAQAAAPIRRAGADVTS
jgi:hypothetical protein